MRSKQPLKVPKAARATVRSRRGSVTRLAPSGTKERLVEAALKTLRTRGFSGTTARAIARVGKVNQALVFYHFGSVDALLLAALDLTSQRRLARYRTALAGVSSLADLVREMARLYTEDVAVGHVAAVQEMVAGGSSVAGLRNQVVARMEPWVAFAEEIMARLVKGTLLEPVRVSRDLAFAAVAFYFGIETLTHLDGDRGRADALFKTGKRLAPLADEILRHASWTGEQP